MINRHVLYDIWVEDRGLLARVDPIRDILCSAAAAGGATVLHEHFHQFAPCGVTGFLLLAESHISVHTWVEEGFAAVDIFTCGPMNTDKVLDVIRDGFKPVHASVRRMVRGGDSGPAYSNSAPVDEACPPREPR